MPKRKRQVAFEDALELSVENLQSAEFAGREDAQETLQSLPQLVQINELGFLTIDSQEGVIEEKMRERAYVSGFMMRPRARGLLKFVALNSDKLFTITPIDKESKLSHPQYDRDERIPLTIDNNQVHTTESAVLPKTVFEQFRKEAHIKPNKDLVHVFALDPVWGRRANAQDGLWTILINGLRQLDTQ